MESMIRRQGVGFNNDFNIAHIEIPDYLAVKKLQDKELELGWNNPNDYLKTQPIANKWFDSLETLVLLVPSAVLTACNNYVINSIHPDFDKIKLIALTPLIPDRRIEEILKGKIIL